MPICPFCLLTALLPFPLLDMQRAVNIEITLAKIGLSGPDIATALIEMDEEKLTKNKLELLNV